MKNLIRVFSDNYDGQLMTTEAYHELRLQMSTGDFHTHKYEWVGLGCIQLDDFDWDQVIELEDLVEK